MLVVRYCPYCECKKVMIAEEHRFSALVHHIDHYHPEESPRAE